MTSRSASSDMDLWFSPPLTSRFASSDEIEGVMGRSSFLIFSSNSWFCVLHLNDTRKSPTVINLLDLKLKMYWFLRYGHVWRVWCNFRHGSVVYDAFHGDQRWFHNFIISIPASPPPRLSLLESLPTTINLSYLKRKTHQFFRCDQI